MSRLIPIYIEQGLRIETLERAVIASEQDYERMKAAAQAAYRAMVAMELSDGSKREWEAAVDGLKAALAEVPLYQKQKPLTDEQIRLLVGGDDEAQEWNRKVVKAIERAHGIGVEDE